MTALTQSPRSRMLKPMRFDRNLPVLGRRSKSELVEIAHRAFMGVAGARAFIRDPDLLREFIWEVSRHYHNNPYHNFQHAVDTTNVMAWLLSLPRIQRMVPDLYTFILLLSALVHDLDHPGTDNQWEIKTQSDRARRYQNVAVLEHHSLDLTLDLLKRPEFDLFGAMPPALRKDALALLGMCVLATDFSMHRAFLQELEMYLNAHREYDVNNPSFLSLLSRTLIKAADISNTSKKFEQARLWGRRVMREYWAQGEQEKRRKLPIGPLNDRKKVEFHGAQGWFIENQVTPLFRLLTRLDDDVQEAVETLVTNYGIYKKLAEQRAPAS